MWGSKIGFVLAAAGSAIGLGNIWRFPYVTGNSGGAAFVLVYILFVVLIGVSVMLAEFTIGRATQRNPIGAFKKLFPNTGWKFIGVLGVTTGIGILSFYNVVAGWTIGYFFKTLTGAFSHQIALTETNRIFTDFVANPWAAIGFSALFMLLTILVVQGGVSSGIERWSKILMPLLLLLMVGLAIRSVTLPGASAGISFYLKPDFTKLTPTVWAMALGQALFSLSLGMGAMITYGSYISKKDFLPASAGWVALSDTLIAILAGFMIFPAVFAMGANPDSGPGLVFILLPSIFGTIPGGSIFGALFFLLLTIAALTSTISLLETIVAYFIDDLNWSRKSAALAIGAGTFILGIPSALSFGIVPGLTKLPFFGIGFLDLFNVFFGNYTLAIGALLISIFIGYKWGVAKAIQEIEAEGNCFKLKKIWIYLIRFLCPIAIAVVLGFILITGKYF